MRMAEREQPSSKWRTFGPHLTWPSTIKTRIYNATVKPVLLYGAETWRTMAGTLKKILTFINTCPRRIVRIWLPETICKKGLDQATTSRRWNPPKMLEMDWTHPQKASNPYCMSSPDLEPTGKEKARPPKKHLVPWPGGRNKDNELHLGTAWETGPGLGCLESSCWWLCSSRSQTQWWW